MTNSWASCIENLEPYPITGQLFRVVQSQEQVATNRLVDDLHEQERLEQLLETSKPSKPAGSEQLHYLLATPFRYPPLKHGSRFGQKSEPALFYGSHQMATAIAETAYYRHLFWQGMVIPPPTELITQHTIFNVSYATDAGLQLQQQPFDNHRDKLTHLNDYSATQQLGQAMRESGVEAFEFVSSRNPERGINVGLFSPTALVSNKPLAQQAGLCQTSANSITFSTDRTLYQFSQSSFATPT